MSDTQNLQKQPEHTIIRSLLNPKLEIDSLQLDDLYTGTSEKLPPGQKNEYSYNQIQNDLGSEYPFIAINGYIFQVNEIKFFEINSTRFLPTVTFVFHSNRKDIFKTHKFPKDGDILSVFIRARNNAFKPIRNDYVIKSVSLSKENEPLYTGTCIIDAELFIPHLKDQIIKSYRGTSFNTLLQIAKDLKIGFATNETHTDDDQAWICPNNTWEEFINQISSASFKNLDSFYRCFIDVYYHLNFINVNNQIEGDNVIAAGIIDATIIQDKYATDKGVVESSQTESSKFLSNLPATRATNAHIRGFEIINNSTRINQTFGYKYNIQFFDLKSLELWNIYIDPKTSEGENVVLKGRLFPKEDAIDNKGLTESKYKYWKSQNRSVWKGIQSKNVHDKFLYAIAHNERNLLELQKMYLKVDVNRWNPNIYVGEKVPIIIISETDGVKAGLYTQADDRELNEDAPGSIPIINQYYSGFYMVNGMSITWNSKSTQYLKAEGQDPQIGAPSFFQTFILTRREWPTPI